MKLRGEIRNPEALGTMLRQARLLQNLSQRDLAEQLGIEQKQVWEMESGKSNRFAERLFKMMRATGAHLYIEIEEQAGDAQ